MLVIRLVTTLFVIATCILLGLYIYTQETKYLTLFKRLTRYMIWFVLFVLVLFLISRILRI
jgi:choline-glycine betaine transporter